MINQIGAKIKIFITLILLFFSGITSAVSSHSILLWHSLDGPLQDKFTEIVNRFNQKPEMLQANTKILLEYKGKYEECLGVGLKAIGTQDAPHILQVYEMGNLVMQVNPKGYVALNQLTQTPSPLLQNHKFIPFFRTFYKGSHGDKSLQSLPFSASTTILFYNKDAFRKAGLNPEQPPKTWEDFEKIAAILKEKTQATKSVLASGWLSGHHIDHTGAWHNQRVATKGNGIDGSHAQLVLNHPFFVYHLNKLAAWHQAGLFSLEQGAHAEEAFAKEDIVILTHSANRLPIIQKLVNNRFEIGVGYFPYWKSKIATPQNTIAGGASFWAISGHSPKDYAIIQQFFEYLASPTVQAQWHQETCYMPVVIGAEAIARKNKFYEQGLKGKAAKIGLDSFAGRDPKEYSRGILLPQYPKVREVMIQEMKEAIKGNKTSEQALAQIVTVGNQIMQEGSQRPDER